MMAFLDAVYHNQYNLLWFIVIPIRLAVLGDCRYICTAANRDL